MPLIVVVPSNGHCLESANPKIMSSVVGLDRQASLLMMMGGGANNNNKDDKGKEELSSSAQPNEKDVLEALDALCALVRLATQEVKDAQLEKSATINIVETMEQQEPPIPPAPPAPLPPRPSETCDCHGDVVCRLRREYVPMCHICMDELAVDPQQPRPYHAQGCHLMLCEDCLTDTIEHAIAHGQTEAIRCPCCHYYVLAREVNERCSPKAKEQYHTFQLRKLLGKMPNLKECTSPGCGNAVFYEEECAADRWECEVCAETCSFCKGPAHKRGAQCEASRKFRSAERRQKLWVAFSISKRCPSCRTPIIKRGGCPHMTCQNPACRHEFCWHCKKDWKTHGTCIFTKILIGAAIVVSPAVVVAAGALFISVTVPLISAQPFQADEDLPGRLPGKYVVKKAWKFTKKLWREFF